MSELNFNHFTFQGVDAEKFLQGQVTVNVTKLNDTDYQATAICDLKGRVHFGLWLKRHSADAFSIVIVQDLADEFQAHIKKFGAFAKAHLHQAETIYPTIQQNRASFSLNSAQCCPIETWKLHAIQHGDAWIGATTSHLFQPQELRLHQRHGVDYDKGCYLGQEIIARLWFKAQPKHWLHLIRGQGDCPADGASYGADIEIVNAVTTEQGWLALVVAKPTALEQANVQILALPDALNGDVARAK